VADLGQRQVLGLQALDQAEAGEVRVVVLRSGPGRDVDGDQALADVVADRAGAHAGKVSELGQCVPCVLLVRWGHSETIHYNVRVSRLLITLVGGGSTGEGFLERGHRVGITGAFAMACRPNGAAVGASRGTFGGLLDCRA